MRTFVKSISTVEHILCTCAKYEHSRRQYTPLTLNFHLYYCVIQNVVFQINYLTDVNL